jgi:prepilin-type N-terminal cleavage/methylation domain-containing protein
VPPLNALRRSSQRGRPGRFEGPRRRGFALIESLVCTVIVAALLVAALSALASLTAHRTEAAQQTRARILADELMAEILGQDYADPGGASAIGPESGESAGNRSAFDDVDDYHGWAASPPVSRDGVPLANTTGWQRTARVEWVGLFNLATAVTTDQGVKRITVRVSEGGELRAELTAIRTREGDRLQ